MPQCIHVPQILTKSVAMYFTVLALVSCVSVVLARGGGGGPATENYKDQYCTDPRTMKKHAAYTEWADAYSCTRHRCQPGGRNLAIYTVGCKRVEAPESAIECEEVVEDTNMQFPYCCTRLRCLVVVRGEVWTRVLGQPWETLPAAPWSHMYKMKKPPPADSSFLPKNVAEGPVYELAQEPPSDDKNRRSKKAEESSRISEIRPRTATERSGSPDIVIALSTGNEKDSGKDNEKDYLSQTNKLKSRRKHLKSKSPAYPPVDRSEAEDDTTTIDDVTEKDLDASDDLARPALKTTKKKSWTPESMSHQQWSENDVMVETENAAKDSLDNMPDFRTDDKAKPSNNLQDLVDAIGTRMRDIENVVQKMSEKVRKPEKETDDYSPDLSKRSQSDDPLSTLSTAAAKKTKSDNFKSRFNKGHGSKYLHNNQELAPEKPSFPDDAVNLNGYFSDASNTVRRGGSNSKDSPGAAIYMAPVDNRRVISNTDGSDLEDTDKKHKKHHKKKKGHHKKRHSATGTGNSILKEDKRTKNFNKLNSLEMQLASLEDSSLII